MGHIDGCQCYINGKITALWDVTSCCFIDLCQPVIWPAACVSKVIFSLHLKAKIIFLNVGVTETTQLHLHSSRNRNFENLVFKFSEETIKLRHVFLSVCPSVPMEQLTAHWKYFHAIWYFRTFLESVYTVHVSLKSDMNNGTLRRKLSTFMIMSDWILLRMRDISDKYSREILKLFWCSINILQKPCHLSDVKKYGRASHPTYENITRRMRFACWINKARIQTVLIFNSYYCLQKYEIFCSSTK
jgi:hypothetical protein